MLSEAFAYLTTPCTPHLKSMGYLKELIATEARSRRCRTHWQSHIDQTRAVIIEAMHTVPDPKKAVVLGAGILTDIPLKALSETFAHVELVDVCFLEQTRQDIRPYPNVETISLDITGVAKPLYDLLNNNRHDGALPLPVRPDALSLADADLVISANVLSQLPLIPLSYAKGLEPQPDSDALQAFARAIIKRHRDDLDTCPGTVCLISEVERRYCDAGRILETADPLFGLALRLEGKAWLWDMAPKREVAKDYAIQNRVIGTHWRRPQG